MIFGTVLLFFGKFFVWSNCTPFTLINVSGLKKKRLEKFKKFFFFQKQSGRSVFNLMVPSGIFQHWKFDKILTIMSHTVVHILKKLAFVNFERGTDLGRSRLVFVVSFFIKNPTNMNNFERYEFSIVTRFQTPLYHYDT